MQSINFHEDILNSEQTRDICGANIAREHPGKTNSLRSTRPAETTIASKRRKIVAGGIAYLIFLRQSSRYTRYHRYRLSLSSFPELLSPFHWEVRKK
ncbi:hypothetical protein TWF569_009602 [Orbilia oligospora]|uniref:Uncharacterized protein n=1 Tax=Orbilia oligospora TaxID=2813651 RepID=A0A7C8JDK9_ORBOL|nr:hypothetical protein TWF706_004186 [Orbilia oligospora]KAF3112918.1 hypothetical protein TWF102_004301 [Orbilia oligospora]KAF3117843.1 hypothetical protein TWF103_004509 [Orbilia oligospora]KAF3135985.1 hypothetical protein TWF569_009602 [Orbilia oligospora]KAF3151866.1 hypothetical protein TWF594_005634 [Orbilia oligospora]